jgi:hypothetical protein
MSILDMALSLIFLIMTCCTHLGQIRGIRRRWGAELPTIYDRSSCIILNPEALSELKYELLRWFPAFRVHLQSFNELQLSLDRVNRCTRDHLQDVGGADWRLRSVPYTWRPSSDTSMI